VTQTSSGGRRVAELRAPDIADIGPRLLSGTAANDLTLGKGTPAVKMKVVRETGGVLAVIVNSAATRQEVKLLRQAGTFGRLLLQNGKQIEVKAGVATLPLEPFGCRHHSLGEVNVRSPGPFRFTRHTPNDRVAPGTF
jgi:hypothetical protein